MTGQLHTHGVFVLPGGQIYGGVSHSIDPGIETVREHGDGHVDDAFAAVIMQSPRFSLSTRAVAAALALVGIGGVDIAAAADLWLQRFAAGGTRMTGANSTKFTFALGMACLRTLECDDGGLATLAIDVVARSSDGITAPMTVTAASTMPALTLLDQAFTLGPVSINGTTLGGVKSTRVDFGKQLVVESGDGDTYPTFIAIQARQPSILVRTTQTQHVAGGGLGQIIAQGATDSAVYFRRVAKNGTRVANATTQHLSFSVDDGIITAREVAATSRSPAMLEYLIEPTFDGTNDVVAIGNGVAIP